MKLKPVGVLLIGVFLATPAFSQTWTEQKLVPTGGLGIGSSVAVSGSVAVVGARNVNTNQGAAYVYVRQTICSAGGCNWVLAQTLTASDGAAGDGFGTMVSFDGQTILIGAPGADVSGHVDQGAAYTFTKSGSTWTQGQKLVSYDGAAGDAFGISVAVSGANALVGASSAMIGTNAGQGAAYRFYRVGAVGGNFLEAQKFSADDGGVRQAFGISVAVSDTVAFIGAGDAVSYGNYGIGAVYAFGKSCDANGTCLPDWPLSQRLVPADATTDMSYGESIAFDGTTLVVGAPYGLGASCADGTCTQGNAYVYANSSGAWPLQQELLGANVNADFGIAVAVDGTRLVVGADSDGWPSPTGAAYIYDKTTTWNLVHTAVQSDPTTGSFFGASVDVSGNTVLVGAPDAGSQGAAYSYTKTN